MTITASGSTGNCVIAALDDSGYILWRWHIWVTNYDLDNSSVMNGNTYVYNNYTWMDRNLGASTTTPSDKTIFDPCPAGWRVPAWSGGLSPWNGFNETTFPFYNAFDWNLSYGRVYTSAGNTYYPAASYRDSEGMLFDIGSEGPGVYWSASPSQNNMVCDLSFSNGEVMLYDDYRMFGFSVRCVRE